MKQLIATFTAKPEHLDQVRDVLRRTAAASRTEPGVLCYDLFDQADSTNTVSIEHYKDDAAFDAHLASDHVKTAVADLDGLLAQDITVQIIEPLDPSAEGTDA